MFIIVAIALALLGFAAGCLYTNHTNKTMLAHLTKAHEAEVWEESKKAFQNGWDEAGRSAGYVHDRFYKLFPKTQY